MNITYQWRVCSYKKYEIFLNKNINIFTWTDESSLIVTVPLDTNILLTLPPSSYTVTTPGLSTANVGTWAGKIPKLPENDGTSTCFTFEAS